MPARRSPFVLLVAALVALGSLPAAGTTSTVRDRRSGVAAPPIDELPAFVPGQVVVQLEHGPIRRVLDGLPTRVVADVQERIGVYDVAVLELTEGVGVRRGAALLSRHGAVESAVPNYIGYFSAIPNDPRFDEQWGMHNFGQVHLSNVAGQPRRGQRDADVDAPRAWETEEGDGATVIAVVDTGVDVRHPDLDDSIWTNPGEVPGDGIDNDGNGFVDDVHGWDVAENDNTLVERNTRAIPYQHGTHVAGVIGAEKDNARGIAGVCPGCEIMPVKISEPIGSGARYMSFRLSDELEGFAYAQMMGADIVNASFGSPRWAAAEREALIELGRAGTLAVVAAGNFATNHDVIERSAIRRPDRLRRPLGPFYPAAYDLDTMVTVAASDHRDSFGLFTDSGHETVDLAAPGVDIFSTVPEGRYDLYSGTSLAAPYVAGAAGLVKSHRPNASPEGLRSALLSSVDKPPRLSLKSPVNPGIATRTSGRLNAAEALTAALGRDFGPSDGTIRGARRVRGSARGRLHGPVDYNDVFRRALDHGDRMVVSLRSKVAPFDLYVWKEGTEEIWQLEEPCFSEERGCALLDWRAGSAEVKRIRFRVGRPGKYFFHVSARRKEQGRYTLRVRRR